jgi:hypothetical protein
MPYVTEAQLEAIATIIGDRVKQKIAASSGSGPGYTDLTAAAPAAPAANTSRLFRKALANRQLPAFVGPGGQDTAIQSALHGNAIFHVSPSSGTAAPAMIGGTLTTTGTLSLPALASTSLWASIQRKRFQTAATAAAGAGMRTAYTQWWRGNGNKRGGFFRRLRFGQHLNVNGAQAFIGFCASAAALATTAGAVSALINSFGVGYDTTDASTGNWFLYRNDGSGVATKLDLGALMARSLTADGFDLSIFCLPHSATGPQSIWAEITRVSDGAQVLAPTEFTLDLPVNTTFLAHKAECNNGAIAAATGFEVASDYTESDF